jgi:anti-anti-sigma factor
LLLLPDLVVTVKGLADSGLTTATVVVVTVEGELDLATEATLATQLRETLNVLPPSCAVVLDLAGVGFLGVPGIRGLLAFAVELGERGMCARFLFPARLKRIMIRVGLAHELANLSWVEAAGAAARLPRDAVPCRRGRSGYS